MNSIQNLLNYNYKKKINNMEKLKNIIRDNKMNARPEYYSGRGAIMSDLNSEILQGIHKDILTLYGKEAAKNYVKMVADIKVLSATTFLEELYQLFGNDWNYTEREQHASGISIPKNKDGEYDETSMVSGMMGIFSAMSNDRDDTNWIRNDFLHTHGVKKNVVRCYNGLGYYYEK